MHEIGRRANRGAGHFTLIGSGKSRLHFLPKAQAYMISR